MFRPSLLRNTLLLTAARLAMQGMGLLFQIYLSGILGAAGMGKLQLLLTIGGFAMTFGISGTRIAAMNITAARLGRGDSGGMKRAVSQCLLITGGLSITAAAVFCLANQWIAGQFLHDSSFAPAVLLLGLGLPGSCIAAVLDGYFTARGKIRLLVRVDLLDRILSIPATALLLWVLPGKSAAARCCAVLLGSGVGAAVGLLLLVLHIAGDFRRIHEKSLLPTVRPLLQLCLPLAWGSYLRSGLSSLEQFLIPRGLQLHGSSPEKALADYGTLGAMVFPVIMFPAALFSALSDLLIPELSHHLARGEKKSICRRVSACLRMGGVFSALVAGFMFLFGPALGRLLFRSNTAGYYIQVFSPMIFILYLDNLTDGMLKGLGEQLAGVRYNTLTSAMDVLLLLTLLPPLGLRGYLCSFLLTHSVNFALSIRRLYKVTGCPIPFYHGALVLTAASAGILLTQFLLPSGENPVLLLSAAAVYCCLYFLLIFTTGALRPGELPLFMHKKAAE